MKLSEIVPWGRSYEEYVEMFRLDSRDLDKRILGCGDGPASFNCVMHKRSKSVVSCDPLFQFGAAEIRSRINAVLPLVRSQLEATRERYLWTRFKNVAGLCRERMESMGQFIDDYESGKAEYRYRPASLPELPFAQGEFELALVSHLLFLYSEQLSLDFHLAAMTELLRVATEVRIYPLVTLEGVPSPHLAPLLEELGKIPGIAFELTETEYQFQRNANKVLRIVRSE